MTFNISTNPKIVASWDTINSPQAYSYKPAAASYVRDSYYIREEHSGTKKLAKIVLSLAVIAAALAGARAKIDTIKNVNLAKDASSFKGFDKVKFYVAKYGQWVIDNAKKLKFWGKNAAASTKEAAKDASKEGAKDASKA